MLLLWIQQVSDGFFVDLDKRAFDRKLGALGVVIYVIEDVATRKRVRIAYISYKGKINLQARGIIPFK